MDNNEQRDYAEEKYNREFCVPCGTSPCSWDGEPDGFHDPDAPLVTLNAVLEQARELDDWPAEDLLGLVHTAGELWLSTDRADPDDVLNEYQRSLLERAAASHRAATGGLDDFLVPVPGHHSNLGPWCPVRDEDAQDEGEELPQLDCPVCGGKHFEQAGIENCAADHETAPPGGYGQPETWVQYYDPDTGVPLPGPPDTLREMRDPS